jgi:hypothetical protein
VIVIAYCLLARLTNGFLGFLYRYALTLGMTGATNWETGIMTRKATQETPAAEAAPLLGMSRERIVRLIQTRRLKGRRDPERGWLVDGAALERLTRQAPVKLS